MGKLHYYSLQIAKYSKKLYAQFMHYYAVVKQFCFEHKQQIIASIAYIPYIGWLYPLYACEGDGVIQKHAKRGLLYAGVFVFAALVLFLLSFILPRSWRLLSFIVTIVLYINYFIYYAIVIIHIFNIWKGKDFSIPKFEIYLEKIEQYI
ncbi:MAG TPA: hypothetical protein PLH80_03700 [Spirochaetota bacterium]|nr:hypothetical protein [Spirochaetota bacterium]HOR93100.1 hypothetical protein [Spirochaetota bacterium]HOT19159.1 hypothetical protein [Spirochaetota bacterium]HQG42209.1 hypothetical protein [Spirochaetota bacterium]HQI37651.1 hypothetical protein [Spirochaetota bacterium]